MKYIITEAQYKKLISEQGTTTTYGDQIKSTTQSTTSPRYEYGQQIKLGGSSATTATQSTTSSPSQPKLEPVNIKFFYDTDEKKFAGNYAVRSAVQTTNKLIELDLGSFKVYTDCNRILKKDSSFDYEKTKLYSKELAIKVGETFNCKFPN